MKSPISDLVKDFVTATDSNNGQISLDDQIRDTDSLNLSSEVHHLVTKNNYYLRGNFQNYVSLELSRGLSSILAAH